MDNNVNALNPSFVFLNNERDKGIAEYICGVLKTIDQDLLAQFHTAPVVDKEFLGYTRALKTYYNALSADLNIFDAKLVRNEQSDDMKHEVHKYLCKFKLEDGALQQEPKASL